jgi:hypothetical protein
MEVISTSNLDSAIKNGRNWEKNMIMMRILDVKMFK